MDTKEVFRMRMRAARKELGLSQREFAEKLGVSRTIVSDWEQGRSSPGMDKFTDISNVLQKPLVYFFSATEAEGQEFVSGPELMDFCEMAREAIQEMRNRLISVYWSLGYLDEVFESLYQMNIPNPLVGDELVLSIVPESEIKDGEDLVTTRRKYFTKTFATMIQAMYWKLEGLDMPLPPTDRFENDAVRLARIVQEKQDPEDHAFSGFLKEIFGEQGFSELIESFANVLPQEDEQVDLEHFKKFFKSVSEPDKEQL